jgi:hypothetical protein
MLPFYLRFRWLGAQIVFAEVVHFAWALAVALRRDTEFGVQLQSSASVFAVATSLGYFFARLASRFIGVSWLRIRRGLERTLDSRLGRMTTGCGITLIATPRIVNGFFAWEIVSLVPFYCGAVVGSAFSFIVWELGLPREDSRTGR